MTHTHPITRTVQHLRVTQPGERSGHDWWHTYRVWQNALRIQAGEGGDRPTIELAALLHDVADWKLHDGDTSIGPETARRWLTSIDVDPSLIHHVCQVIADISFKGANVTPPELTLEGQIVQDADRLDAIGAIGIARAFAYGGAKGRLIYDPEEKPCAHHTAESYLRSQGTSINHFYEKLLLLKDRMHTATGRELAEARHCFMESFLHQFFAEWNVTDICH